jgi:phage tail-like protein
MRAANTDFMQNFRYHVVANDGDGDPFQPSVQSDRDGHDTNGQAGFQSVTIPELSVEATEYREGIFKWTEKYPGPPTVSELTLMRGITKRDTTFYDMVMASVEGKKYRADVIIYHYQRSEMDLATSATVGDDIRRIECGECFAIRAKPNGDLDSTAGDVSLGEVDIAVEKFEVKYS